MQFWIRSDILKKKSMDSEWEGQMLKDGELKEDEDLQKAYVNAVNNSDLSKTITKLLYSCYALSIPWIPERQVYKGED